MNDLLTSDVVQLLHERNVPRSAASVRLYEKQGILPAVRTASGTRLYNRHDVERLAESLRAKKGNPS